MPRRLLHPEARVLEIARRVEDKRRLDAADSPGWLAYFRKKEYWLVTYMRRDGQKERRRYGSYQEAGEAIRWTFDTDSEDLYEGAWRRQCFRV